eukprot:scaffold128088_cov41-Attheya_sp.AAC.2
MGGKLMRKYVSSGCKEDVRCDVASQVVAERPTIGSQHSRSFSDQPSGSQCSRKSHPNKKRKHTASACIYTPGGKLKSKCVCASCTFNAGQILDENSRSTIDSHQSRSLSDHESGSEQPSGSQCSRKSHPNKKRKHTASACIYTPGGKLKSKCVCASCTFNAGQVVDENSRSTIDSHQSRSLSDHESGSEPHPQSHPKKKRQTTSICDHTPESNQSKESQLEIGKTSYEEDSDKDEEDSMYQTYVANVPEWAQNPNLQSAFKRQLLNSFGSDQMFHDVETCNLESIFGTKEARYRDRSSTGDWPEEGLLERSKLVNKRGGGTADLRDKISSVANSVAKASKSLLGRASSSSADLLVLSPFTYEVDNSFCHEESSARGLNHSSPGIVPDGVPIDDTTSLDDKTPNNVPYFPWGDPNLMASSSSSSEIASFETPDKSAISPGSFEKDLDTALSAIRIENDTASSSDSRSLSFDEEVTRSLSVTPNRTSVMYAGGTRTDESSKRQLSFREDEDEEAERPFPIIPDEKTELPPALRKKKRGKQQRQSLMYYVDLVDPFESDWGDTRVYKGTVIFIVRQPESIPTKVLLNRNMTRKQQIMELKKMKSEHQCRELHLVEWKDGTRSFLPSHNRKLEIEKIKYSTEKKQLMVKFTRPTDPTGQYYLHRQKDIVGVSEEARDCLIRQCIANPDKIWSAPAGCRNKPNKQIDPESGSESPFHPGKSEQNDKSFDCVRKCLSLLPDSILSPSGKQRVRKTFPQYEISLKDAHKILLENIRSLVGSKIVQYNRAHEVAMTSPHNMIARIQDTRGNCSHVVLILGKKGLIVDPDDNFGSHPRTVEGLKSLEIESFVEVLPLHRQNLSNKTRKRLQKVLNLQFFEGPMQTK